MQVQIQNWAATLHKSMTIDQWQIDVNYSYNWKIYAIIHSSHGLLFRVPLRLRWLLFRASHNISTYSYRSAWKSADLLSHVFESFWTIHSGSYLIEKKMYYFVVSYRPSIGLVYYEMSSISVLDAPQNSREIKFGNRELRREVSLSFRIILWKGKH